MTVADERKNILQEIRERKAARAARRKQLAKRRTAASQERMRIINQLARNNKVGIADRKRSLKWKN